MNAGHPLPLLVRGAKVVDTLACHPAPPLGLGFGEADRVLFYTDGSWRAATWCAGCPCHLGHQGAKPRDDATMVFLEWPGPSP